VLTGNFPLNSKTATIVHPFRIPAELPPTWVMPLQAHCTVSATVVECCNVPGQPTPAGQVVIKNGWNAWGWELALTRSADPGRWSSDSGLLSRPVSTILVRRKFC
jgi:hypothetical protein